MSSEVSYLLANTDLSSIDSFAEVSDAVSAEVSRAIVAETSLNTKVTTLSDNTLSYITQNRPKVIGFNESPDGLNAEFTAPVVSLTAVVFLNGLMQLIDEDYTIYSSGGSAVVTFSSAPALTDRINVYGVPSGTTWLGSSGGGKG